MRCASRCHLSMLGRRVAVAEEQQVHLVRGRAVLDHGPHARPRPARRAIDERRGGIDGHRPQLLEGPVVPAAEDHHAHRPRGRGEADRLVERARDARFASAVVFPLAVDAGEAAREEDAPAARRAPRTGTCRARSRRGRGRGGPATVLRARRRRGRSAPRRPCRCGRSRRAGCAARRDGRSGRRRGGEEGQERRRASMAIRLPPWPEARPR